MFRSFCLTCFHYREFQVCLCLFFCSSFYGLRDDKFSRFLFYSINKCHSIFRIIYCYCKFSCRIIISNINCHYEFVLIINDSITNTWQHFSYFVIICICFVVRNRIKFDLSICICCCSSCYSTGNCLSTFIYLCKSKSELACIIIYVAIIKYFCCFNVCCTLFDIENI